MANFMLRYIFLTSIISLTTCFTSYSAEPERSFEARKADWKKQLETNEFAFPKESIGVSDSLRLFKSNCELRIVKPPGNRYLIQYVFIRDSKEILSIRGHLNSSFRESRGMLYFAHYFPDSPGCRVCAYDLETGKQVWETKLTYVGPPGASAYANQVLLTFAESGASVVITGRESYADYKEVLDGKSGKLLAHKTYRQGF